MTGTDLAHAQRVLRKLRDTVDRRVADVVRSSVQGEDVAEGTFSSDPSSLDADRYWPEAGWPDQVEDTQ